VTTTPAPDSPARQRPASKRAAGLLRVVRRAPGRERLLRKALDRISEGVVVVARDGRVALVNDTARDLLGLAATPRHRDELPLAVGSNGTIASGEQVITAGAGGARRHLHVDARPLCGDGSVVAVLRDVTERSQTDRRLASHILALEGQLSLLDLAHDAVLIRDAENRITYCNRAAEALYGRSRSELVGRVSHEIFDTRFPVSRQDVDDALQASGLWAGELRHLRADGSTLVVHSRQSMRRDGAGRPHAIIEINSDITARRQVETRLRATEEQQRLLLEGARDHAIFMLDADGLVMSWSTSAERLKGYREEEILGKPYRTFFGPGEVASGAPEKILSEATAAGRVEVEGVRVRRDGSTFWANTVVTAAYGDDGSLRGFVKVTRDETLRRQAEQQVRALNAELRELDRLKSDLIATVSHELRTPLTSIRGYTELLLDEDAGSLGTTQRRMLDLIDTNGARLLSLVEDLLSVARVDAGEFAPARESVPVPDLLARVDAAARPGLPAGLVLVLAVPPGAPTVIGDPVELERALLNLMSNAMKFSPDGGVVTLGCEYDAAEVRITVADTGIGIAIEEQEHLFERFFRATAARENHIQGTGLGLALVKTIMEAHGGRVTLRSVPGAGTTVTLHLPR
jgi:PAS domain S-box-containing protein